MLATAAMSRAKPGWSGKEESGKEGKRRESEKKASRGSCVDLRLPSPKWERAIGRERMDGIQEESKTVNV